MATSGSGRPSARLYSTKIPPAVSPACSPPTPISPPGCAALGLLTTSTSLPTSAMTSCRQQQPANLATTSSSRPPRGQHDPPFTLALDGRTTAEGSADLQPHLSPAPSPVAGRSKSRSRPRPWPPRLSPPTSVPVHLRPLGRRPLHLPRPDPYDPAWHLHQRLPADLGHARASAAPSTTSRPYPTQTPTVTATPSAKRRRATPTVTLTPIATATPTHSPARLLRQLPPPP